MIVRVEADSRNSREALRRLEKLRRAGEPGEFEGIGGTVLCTRIGIAVLMDIRRELRALNAILGCPNFTGIPHELRIIRKNTTKRKRRAR